MELILVPFGIVVAALVVVAAITGARAESILQTLPRWSVPPSSP